MANSQNVINYDGIDSLSINIILKLLENQDLLKCLFYNTSNALTQADLTDDEKYAMIDQLDTVNTKIFITPFPSNVTDDAEVEIRFFIRTLAPENIILSRVIFDFVIIVHESLWVLSGGKQRALTIIQELLDSLNGEYINGLGKLYLVEPINIVKFADNVSGYIVPLQTWSD
jgi:hypothetical protein